MQNGNQQSSARIRNVPINVEPRSNTTPRQSGRHRDHQAGYHTPHNEGPNSQQTRYRDSSHQQREPDRHHDDRPRCQSSPSANVSGGQQQSARRDKDDYQYHNQGHQNSSLNQDHPQKSAPKSEQHSNGSQPQANSDSHNAGSQPTSPSLKEPIPMPPPPISEQQEQPNNNSTGNSEQVDRLIAIQDQIDDIKQRLVALLLEITNFAGRDSQARDFKYLDEMLTRCVLQLDELDCANFDDLRQQRKMTIKLVDKATDVLSRKVQLNLDTYELTESMSLHLARQLQRHEQRQNYQNQQ